MLLLPNFLHALIICFSEYTNNSFIRRLGTFTARWLSRHPVDSIAHHRQRGQGWWKKSIGTGVMYHWPLDCQITIRYGVLYYRYWSAPIGCIVIVIFIRYYQWQYKE